MHLRRIAAGRTADPGNGNMIPLQKGSAYHLIRRLQRQGVPMDGSIVRLLPQGLRIAEAEMYVPTELFDTESGGTGFVAELRIFCDVPQIIIDSFRLELEWGDVEPCSPESQRVRGAQDNYSFPGRQDLTFSRQMVVNDRLLRPFRNGDCVRGVVMGICSAPIPEHLSDGHKVTADFAVITLLGERFTYPLQIRVDRTYGIRPQATSTSPSQGSVQHQPNKRTQKRARDRRIC